MGSSNSDALHDGSADDWCGPLRACVKLLDGVIDDIWSCNADETQFDNAFSDGMSVGHLMAARSLIQSQLPKEVTADG